ncbi:hypothetical protein OWV82_012469 [Melia azedarach]|uniref:Uncharacterized protein n=1 Tax=Melia azedarach TaxID=155640 RepID=A0ACC1Y3U7_MELAZ|nr:hypothetical protein OWV82_012469 [Melia azedarach]
MELVEAENLCSTDEDCRFTKCDGDVAICFQDTCICVPPPPPTASAPAPSKHRGDTKSANTVVEERSFQMGSGYVWWWRGSGL